MANNSTNDFTQVFIKKKPVVTDWLQTDENCGETCLATVNDSVGTLLYKNLFQIVQYCIKKMPDSSNAWKIAFAETGMVLFGVTVRGKSLTGV